MVPMEGLIWVLLPGFVALATGLLVWFVMQSRMEVMMAQEQTRIAEERNSFEAERAAINATLEPTVRAAEESAKRLAFDNFLNEIHVEQRHYTREHRLLAQTRRSLVLQERMYFRNIPLSDWIEHEITLDEGADVDRMVADMTVFDKGVLSIVDVQRPRKALA